MNSAGAASIYIVQNFDAVSTLTSGGLGTANLPYAVYKRSSPARVRPGVRRGRRSS